MLFQWQWNASSLFSGLNKFRDSRANETRKIGARLCTVSIQKWYYISTSWGKSLSRQGFHYTAIAFTYKWIWLWARHLTMRQVPFHFHVFQTSILIFCLGPSLFLSHPRSSAVHHLSSTAVADSTDVQLPPQISLVLKVRRLQITSHAVFASMLLGCPKYTPCWVLYTVLYTCQNMGCQSGHILFM